MLKPKLLRRSVEQEMPDWPVLFDQLAATSTNPLLKRFYQADIASASTPVADLPLVALDIETTGLDPARDAIVSIGLIPFDLHRIRCREAVYRVLNPGKPLASRSVVIHGITHSQVQAGPDLGEILPELLDALAGKVVVVHCRRIERYFLHAAVKERMGEGIVFPTIDTMEIEARFVRQGVLQQIARFFGRSPQSIRLAASRTRYRLPHYSPHHALTDALATAELFQAQVAWRFSPQTPVGDLWH